MTMEPTIGTLLDGGTKTMTYLRQDWYGNAQVSAIAGEPRSIGQNIHTDAEYARSQGWPDVNASGMVSLSWLSSMLLRQYGRAYLEGGELRAKFIRPIYMGREVVIGGEVTDVANRGAGREVVLTLWVKDTHSGELLTEGDARIPLSVPARGEAG
jgi:acyl dehydratase